MLSVSLPVTDVVINATDARPARASWRDGNAANEVPLGHLRRLVAADPRLGLGTLRGLRDCEQRRVFSEVWVGATRYMAGEWARLGQMGYRGAEDEGIWTGMVGGDWEGEGALKEESPPKDRTTTPQTPSHQNW